jgi:hypothetical protein
MNRAVHSQDRPLTPHHGRGKMITVATHRTAPGVGPMFGYANRP